MLFVILLRNIDNLKYSFDYINIKLIVTIFKSQKQKLYKPQNKNNAVKNKINGLPDFHYTNLAFKMFQWFSNLHSDLKSNKLT